MRYTDRTPTRRPFAQGLPVGVFISETPAAARQERMVMDFEKFHLYAVEGESAVAKIAAFKEAGRARHEARQAWAKSHGGTSAITRGDDVIGIAVDPGTEPPTGWKLAKKQTLDGVRILFPNTRTKIGKKLLCEMPGLRKHGLADLAAELGAKKWVCGGRCLYQSVCWCDGGNPERWFLAVPRDGDKPTPEFDGCRLLKLSEFYAMREEAEASKAGAA